MNVLVLCAHCNAQVWQMEANSTSSTEWTCPYCGVVQTIIYYTKAEEARP